MSRIVLKNEDCLVAMDKMIEKISSFIYERGLNLSGGIKTTPKQEGIEASALIDTVSIGVEYSVGKLFIRANFRGSKKYFEFPIKEENYEKWGERIKILYIDSTADFDFDNSEPVDF